MLRGLLMVSLVVATSWVSASEIYPFAANVANDTPFGTSNQAAHAHSLILNLRSDTTSITMPYLQLLACEKD